MVYGLAMGGEHSNDSSTAPTLNCPGIIYVSGVAGGRQGEAARGQGEWQSIADLQQSRSRSLRPSLFRASAFPRESALNPWCLAD